MSDDAKPPVPAPARPRRPFVRAYVETWLLSAFLVFSSSMLWHVGEVGQGRAGAGSVGAVFLSSPLLALLGLPALWLVRLFRESSPSTWLRFVRRLLLGAICGVFPAALLSALMARKEGDASQGAGILWGCGLVFGAIAGLVDAMHLDLTASADRASFARGDDELA